MIGILYRRLSAQLVEIRPTQHPGIIGLPEKRAAELSMRIRSACSEQLHHRETVKLSIEGTAKASLTPISQLDLPAALAHLGHVGAVAVGELALDGAIRSVAGVCVATAAARDAGYTEILVPTENAAEAALVGDIDVIPVSSLTKAHAYMQGRIPRQPPTPWRADELPASPFVLGCRSVLVVGRLTVEDARACVGSLPQLTREESTECTALHSLARTLVTPAITARPFRAPHHTVSEAGLTGGQRPGELALAHHGVLYLSSCLEMRHSILTSVLTSPCSQWPSTPRLVIGQAPACPCERAECTCTTERLASYTGRLERAAALFECVIRR